MSRHEFGTVRVIPADYSHFFHQVNRYDSLTAIPADAQLPRRNNPAREFIKTVVTIHEPGRHRVETVPDNVATIFVTEQVNFNGPAFECVREWDHQCAMKTAIGFEYLPV